jgi:hypothetical protein
LMLARMSAALSAINLERMMGSKLAHKWAQTLASVLERGLAVESGDMSEPGLVPGSVTVLVSSLAMRSVKLREIK